MQHRTAKLIVWVAGGLLAGSAAYASGSSGTAAGAAPPLPAPPGPYVSSRPYLTPGGGGGGEAEAWSGYYPAPYQRPYVGPGRYWASPQAGENAAPEERSVWRGPRDLPPPPAPTAKEGEAKAGGSASDMTPPPAWQPPPYAYDAERTDSAPAAAAGQKAKPAETQSGNCARAGVGAPEPVAPTYPYYGQAPRWGYPPPPPPYRSPYGPRW